MTVLLRIYWTRMLSDVPLFVFHLLQKLYKFVFPLPKIWIQVLPSEWSSRTPCFLYTAGLPWFFQPHVLGVANLANTKCYKNHDKWLKPCHIGAHLRVFSKSYPVITNRTGFTSIWFSKIFASVRLTKEASALEGLIENCTKSLRKIWAKKAEYDLVVACWGYTMVPATLNTCVHWTPAYIEHS